MKNLMSQLQSEMDRLIFVTKRKYDRMSPKEQEQVIQNIKNMFEAK